MRQETKSHFLLGTVILGFLSIFKKSKASSPFESLNSVCLSRYQSDVTPPIQKRRRTMAFSRYCTEYSDIPLYCAMQDEPTFKPFQGNPTLYLVRESRNPLHLRQKTQGPSLITLLREDCTWDAFLNLALLFNRILGISSLLETIWVAWSFPGVPVLILVFL